MTAQLPCDTGMRPWLRALLLFFVPLSVVMAVVILLSMATASAAGGCGGG